MKTCFLCVLSCSAALFGQASLSAQTQFGVTTSYFEGTNSYAIVNPATLQEVELLTDGGLEPARIAVTRNGLALITNYTADFAPTENGTLSIVDVATHKLISSF